MKDIYSNVIAGFSMKYFLFSAFVILISHLFLVAFYVYADRKNDIKRSKGFYLWILVLGFLWVILDSIKTAKSKSLSKTKVCIYALVLCMVLSYVTTVASNVYKNYNMFSNTDSAITEIDKYYDRYGIEYDTVEEVVYYTEDSAEFKYNMEEDSFYLISQSAKHQFNDYYSNFFMYIDEDGWLVILDEPLEFQTGNGDFGYYNESTDEYFASAEAARWKENGRMFFDY